MATADLLLVGRAGNGKSSTGNSILNMKHFTPKGFSTTSAPSLKEALVGSGRVNGKSVTVVDGFGLSDVDGGGLDAILEFVAFSRKVISMFPNGISALIIVLKYGIRFTQQENESIKAIKSIFGEDVIRNYGIIVMTHGDNFDRDIEDEGTTFETWCKAQTGNVQDIFRECGQRYVLFDNRTRDGGKLDAQNRKLMLKVAEVQRNMPPYSMRNYEHAEKDRKKLIVTSKLPQLQRKTSEFIETITQTLRSLDASSHFLLEDKLLKMDKLKLDIANYKESLRHEDENTDSISPLLFQISITESTLKTKTERIRSEINLKLAYTPPPQAWGTQSQGLNNMLPLEGQIAIGFIVLLIILYLVYKLF